MPDAGPSRQSIADLAEGADERRQVPAVPDEWDALFDRLCERDHLTLHGHACDKRPSECRGMRVNVNSPWWESRLPPLTKGSLPATEGGPR
jgi:hypothetical protein